MKISIDSHEVHVASGGREHQAGKPHLLFVHGAGHSHLTFVLQTRALAYDGWNVIAADLPGHGFSGGEPLETIGAMAEFMLKVMDALSVERAVVCGHSMGGLIALALAAIAPHRVRALVMIGTAAAIAVNPQLVKLAREDEEAAFASMNSWGFGPHAHMAENTWPGANHVGFGIAVMRRNCKGALAAGLVACTRHDGGDAAAAGFTGQAMCVLGEFDRMIPSKNGLALAARLPNCTVHVLSGSGHTIQTEKPRELNALIRQFLARLPSLQPAAF